MPRGRPRNNPAQEPRPEEQSRREQSASAEDTDRQAQAEPDAGHAGADEPETRESPSQEPNEEAAPAHEGPAPDAAESHPEESPETLPGHMAENIRDDIRAFMREFGIGGHRPESVYDSIMGFAGRTPGEGSAMPERSESPAEQTVPLSVRITSLEMDGNTRAFASAEYGGLTVNRIRVKQDEYGALSVVMPKFRQTNGWKDVCSFGTAEARNRLTGEVLDAYERQTAQIRGQAQTAAGAREPERIAGQEETPGFDGPEQEPGGPAMGMSM